jgi:hypothetical protein
LGISGKVKIPVVMPEKYTLFRSSIWKSRILRHGPPGNRFPITNQNQQNSSRAGPCLSNQLLRIPPPPPINIGSAGRDVRKSRAVIGFQDGFTFWRSSSLLLARSRFRP